MGESEKSTEKRRLKRHALSGPVNVYDYLSKTFLGRLVNLHSEGLMIMGHYPFEDGKIYQLDLYLPEPIQGREFISLAVDCLWTRGEDDERVYWAGCKVIDISDQAREDLQQLIEWLGQG